MWQLMSYTDGRKRHEFSPCVGKITGRGHGNPLQYSCLNNPMDRGAWWAGVHEIVKSGHDWRDSVRAHTHTHTHICFKSLILTPEITCKIRRKTLKMNYTRWVLLRFDWKFCQYISIYKYVSQIGNLTRFLAIQKIEGDC